MPTELQFVTCPCQVCNGNIEFDPSDFGDGETRTVECPLCKMETVLFVPHAEAPPILPLSLSPQQATDFLRSVSQSQKSSEHEGVYTIILSPGLVRYLKPEVFWKTDIEKLINAIKVMSENPEIKTPAYYWDKWSENDRNFYNRRKRLPFDKPTLESSGIDCFIEDESWENKLRVHHSFGYFFLNNHLPSHVYSLFHMGLKLGKHFAFGECVDSWVANAIENKDLAESFEKSPEHLVHLIPRDEDFICYVFKKTDFVKERLVIVAKETEEQSAAEEAEKLKKSNYSTFVYIMQDLRNGAFKIGHSNTPGKRERTLQSEVPEIVMRFSIPADEAHEKHLHDYFDSKNMRGEWFALEPSDLLWVISYLKQHGDVERAWVNFEWLGQLYILAKT